MTHELVGDVLAAWAILLPTVGRLVSHAITALGALLTPEVPRHGS